MSGFMTCKELAERWRISQTKVGRMIQAGELKALRFGNALRIPIEEVERKEAAVGSR